MWKHHFLSVPYFLHLKKCDNNSGSPWDSLWELNVKLWAQCLPYASWSYLLLLISLALFFFMTSNYPWVWDSVIHSPNVCCYMMTLHNISLAIKIGEVINQFLSLRSLKLGIKAAWLYYHAQDHLTIRLVAKRGFKESFLQEAYLNQLIPCK